MIEEINEQRYITNIQKISELLEENENILREAGYNPPKTNYTVENKKRIKIPAGYVRTSGFFGEQYHLNDIVVSRNIKNNISYALQLSDYYNFIVNRFNVWGSIETMLYKQMFVNIVSIIAALILECSNNINTFCKECHQISNCSKNIRKEDRSNMKLAVEKLAQLHILSFSDEQKGRLIELYDLRNRIHIRLTDQNEFLDNKYNKKLYNEAIVILQIVDNSLWKNGVPYYKKCLGYEKKV